MKRGLALSLTLLGGAAMAQANYKAGASVEGATEYNFANGFKLLLVPDNSKSSVSVNLTVFVGSRNENYGEHGMAHLFEHMLFKRTKKYASIKQELTKLGGIANGTTWDDRTNYYETFDASDERLAHAIDLEAQRLRSAIVSKDELASEITVVRNELEMGENNPRATTEQKLISAAFQWHNYGQDTIGPISDIMLVPNEKLLAWYDMYYQPDNSMLIIAGKFDTKKTLAKVSAAFGTMRKPKRTLAKTYTVEPVQDGERSVTIRRVGGNPLVEVAYHISALVDPDTAPLTLLTSIFGSKPSGRLYKALVETGKAASVDCNDRELYDPGYLVCAAQMNEGQKAEPARAAMIAELESPKPVTDAETRRAKSEFIKDFTILSNDSQKLAMQLGEYQAMADWRYLYLTRDRIEAATTADVNRVMKKYLKQANRTFAEYVPTEKPDRTEIAPRPADVTKEVEGYVGKKALAAGEMFEATPDNIEKRTHRMTLSNGAKLALLTKKTRGETVNATIVIGLGDAKSLAGQRINANLAAAMLMRGTSKHTREQFKDALNALQANLSISPAGQGVLATLEVRREQLDAALALVTEAFQSPAFDPKEFQSLIKEEVAKLEQAKEDPRAIAGVNSARALDPRGPTDFLYTPTMPEQIAELKAATLADAKAFHARFYGPSGALAAVIGDFDESAVKAQLTSMFDGFHQKQKYERIQRPYVKNASGVFTTVTPDKPMAILLAGQNVPLSEASADAPALVLAEYMLGGGFLNGRIPQRLREKDGLSYGAGSRIQLNPSDEQGVFRAYAIFAAPNRDRVLEGFKEVMQTAIAKGFSDEEVKLAKAGLLQERATSRAEDKTVGTQLVTGLRYNRTMKFDQDFDQKLKALKTSQVNAVLKRYIDMGALNEQVAGDFKTGPKAN